MTFRKVLLTLVCIHACLLGGGAHSTSSGDDARFTVDSPAQLDVLYKYSTKHPTDNVGKRRLRLVRRAVGNDDDSQAYLNEDATQTEPLHERTERSPRLRFLKRATGNDEIDEFQEDSGEEAYIRGQRAPRLRYIKRAADDRYDDLQEGSEQEAYRRETRGPRLRFLKRDSENVDKVMFTDDAAHMYLPSRDARAPRLRFVKRSTDAQLQQQDFSTPARTLRSFFDSNFEFLYRSFLMDKQRRLDDRLLERIREIGKRDASYSDDYSLGKRAIASTALWSILHDAVENAEHENRRKMLERIGKRSVGNA